MKTANKIFITLGSLLISMLIITSCKENPVILDPVFRYYEIKIHPNPMSTFGVISFSLNRNAKIKVSITDSQGRLIVTLIDDMIMRGDNQLSFETSKIPPGGYYAVAESGDESISKGFVVSK